MENYTITLENTLAVPYKVNPMLEIQPCNSLLYVYLREIKIYVPTKIYTRMSIVSLFITSQNEIKQNVYNRRINKCSMFIPFA